MSDFALGQSLAFDRGIDRVTYARREDMPSLPQRQESAPADVAARPQVEALLALPTLDDSLESSIRPEMEHRELMTPTRFRQGLEGIQVSLREAAARLQGSESKHDAEQLRVLNRATRLLNEECQLRDLVQMYRSVLYQG
ncbi:hypothetical protein [Comamonas sp. NLF-1-9]|uniref:type III secretion apparatus assembly protein SctX n=1 Tax=Comamonas sp. NLF-1-9 TaxID=2853163 RepID=UPI001C4387F9|nr:hypothetical protein [Comamonas sp. NLF-1-9]QXL83610.1 hypothetical protein KUD94_10150 [Comamonas sp. NLF-1-9]